MSGEKVSVLVLNYNGRPLLEECFSSLGKQTYPDQKVYLVDNGSQDGSAEYVRKEFPWVRIIRIEKNCGITGAYNHAVKLIDAPYFAFLNNDVRVKEDWLEELVKALESDPLAAAAGSKIYFYDRPDTIHSVGLMITPVGIGCDMGLGEKDRGQYNDRGYRGGVSGASMLMRTSLFREVGGFDESYFAYNEDVDLCWRLLLRGYRMVFQPSSVMYHKVGSTNGPRLSPVRVYYMQKNALRNILKNFEVAGVLRGLVISLFYAGLRFLIYFFSGRWDLAGALARGSVEPLTDLPGIFGQRKKIQAQRVVSDRSLERAGYSVSFLETVREYFRIL